MTRATFNISQEPQQNVGKLTKDRNAEPLRLEFVCGDTASRIRQAIENHKRQQSQRDLLRGAA